MHDEAEHQGAGLRRHYVDLRRLHDHGAVGRVAAQDRRQRAGAAVLLADDAGDARASAQAHAGIAHGLEREERAAEAALHVDGAAAVDPAVLDGRVPWRRRPCRRVADGHDVDVAVQEQVAAGAAARGSPAGRALAIPPDHPERLVAVDLVTPIGMPRQFVEVDRPGVELEAGLPQPGGDTALRRRLVAVEAWNRDQLPEKGDQAVEVERLQRAAFSRGEAGAYRGAPVTPGRAAPAA